LISIIGNISIKDCFVVDVNSAVGSVQCADVDSVADVSEVHFASIFRV
jgi:hypothetical protein